MLLGYGEAKSGTQFATEKAVVTHSREEENDCHAGPNGEAPGSVWGQEWEDMWTEAFIEVSEGRDGQGRAGRLRTG